MNRLPANWINWSDMQRQQWLRTQPRTPFISKLCAKYGA